MNVFGKKVILRTIEETDLQFLRDIHNDPEIEKWIDGWSDAERSVYLYGRIFDKVAYDWLAQQRGSMGRLLTVLPTGREMLLWIVSGTFVMGGV